MLTMLIKMTLVTTLYVLLTALVWKRTQAIRLKLKHKLLIGLLYGLCAVLSTHFGVDYQHMMLNVRDLGPLSAGLFFDPLSGIIAGLIGGIERYIAGTYWGVGSYTRIACSLSTCLAGFVAAGLHIFIFKRRKPSATYAFFMGAVMEVFHMYVVFITHRDDMSMAFYVVKTCSPAMIAFTGIGLAASSIVLQILAGEWENPFHRWKAEEIPVSRRFQLWLFVVTFSILLLNLVFSFGVQTQTAVQQAEETLIAVSGDIRETYDKLRQNEEIADVTAWEAAHLDVRAAWEELSGPNEVLSYFHVGNEGTFDIVQKSGKVLAGDHRGSILAAKDLTTMREHPTEVCFRAVLFDSESLCRTEQLDEGLTLLARLPMTEVYENRDEQVFETAFADIILFAVIYVLISMLVQGMMVNNLELVNASLRRITNGDLNEVVSVRKSSEFASLSDDINQTVSVLKGYIEAAEKRIEQELEFARTIQDSALPKNFVFPRGDFELYATMDPAKEVGGDFYDFFFVDQNTLALVIADVSGKGIPAALFMMRAKTAVRGLAESGKSPSEVLYLANNTLCEGNDAGMFVTVWLGIIDLSTGQMMCSNAGHEYPVLMRAGEDYTLFKEKHGLALAAMEEMRFREYELKLEPGDRLFVYTDGIPEAIDEKVEQYGTDRLVDVLNRVKGKTMQESLPAVREDISRFVGAAEQFDDITMLGFAYYGPNMSESTGMNDSDPLGRNEGPQ